MSYKKLTLQYQQSIYVYSPGKTKNLHILFTWLITDTGSVVDTRAPNMNA